MRAAAASPPSACLRAGLADPMDSGWPPGWLGNADGAAALELTVRGPTDPLLVRLDVAAMGDVDLKSGRPTRGNRDGWSLSLPTRSPSIGMVKSAPVLIWWSLVG